MKFTIPIDYDSLNEGPDIPDQYYNGVGVVNGPVIGIDADLDIVCTQAGPAAMGNVRGFEEYLKNDLNCVVMNLSASNSMNVQSYPHQSGRVTHVAGSLKTNISIKLSLDPLISDLQGFSHLLNKWLNPRGMYVSRINFSHTARDVIYNMNNTSNRPTFKYKPTKVRCSECHGEFLHTELKYDNALWSEGDLERKVDSDTVCPKCGAWDCCELEWEQLPR